MARSAVVHRKIMHDRYLKVAIAFWRDEEGLSVVEYVVGAALLVLAIGTLFSGYDTKLNNRIDGALS